MNVRLELLIGTAVVFGSIVQEAAAADLEAYWRLNETSTASPAVEATGNLPAGTYDATVDPTVAGPFAGFGTGAEFFQDGSVNVGGGSTLNYSNDFSVSAWVNFDNFVGKHSYFGNSGYALRNAGNGTGAPQITTFGVKDYTGDAGALMSGQWHHVVTVLDINNDATFYVDGMFAGTDPHNAPGSGASGDFAIGARSAGSTFESIDGLVDDVGVFSGVLTETEILAIYNLATESELEYDLGEADTLLSAYADGLNVVVIDETVWTAATGLTGAEGAVVNLGNGRFELNLDAGAGFQAAAVPQPASLMIWAVVGVVGVGFLAGRRLRRGPSRVLPTV